MGQQVGLGFLAGGGEMGALMRAHDWSSSPLGPLEAWPQSLRSIVALMMNSRYPMFVAWGPELAFLYNDGYTPIFGAKHPHTLGLPFRHVWPEIWDDVSPLIERALAGEGTFNEDLHLVMQRNGFSEDTWYSFSYSPVRDETGQVAGMFCACTETTEQVLTGRRQAFRLAVEKRLGGLTDPRAVMDAAVEALGQHLDAARVGYCEVQADDATIVFASCFVDGVEPILGAFELDAFGPDNIARQRGGRTEACDDVLADPRQVHATWAAIDTRSFVSVPLIRDGRFTASLYVNFRDVRRWTAAEVALIEDVAARTWDAVERARAQADLARSEARLRLALEAGQLAEITFHIADGTVAHSPAYAELLGHPPATALTLAEIRARYHPDDHDRVVRERAAILGSGQAFYEIEKRIVRPSGQVRWVHGRGRVNRDAEARPVSVTAVYLDDTDRKRADAALRESEARFRHMADSAPALIWTTDDQGDVTFANKHYENLFGRPAADILGGGWTRIVLPEDLERHTAAFVAAFEARAAFRTETRVRDKDGRVRWLRCEGVPRLDDVGTFLGYTGCNVDITEARLAAEELERRVAERTAELRHALGQLHEEVLERKRAEAALRQAQKMEAVGQLTGGLAHDFNNLLAGISGSLELLKIRMAQGRHDEVDRYVTAAQGAANRAAALTHRLLAFSRRQTLEPKATDVGRLVAGMEDLIRRTVGPAVAVEVAGPGGLWNTLVDPSQLENALLNLCINARDAMPSGGRLTIGTGNHRLDERGARTRDLASGEYVSLCVSDNGAGMTPDVVAKAFDPFFTTKPIGQGTGLGLSMIYGFTRQSGGQARIHSEPGRGTTVCLYLPRHLGAVTDADAPAAPSQAPRAGQGETVLVVDDEPTIRMLVTDVLEELSYATIEAEDGASGLDVLRSRARIDLLVTDVGLPGGMNGRQVADAARVLRPGLKVLFITGYAESAALSHGHLEPGMHVLTKPFAMEALAARVKELVSEH